MGQGAEKDSEDAVYVVVVRFVRDHFVLQAQNLAFRAKDVPPQSCLVDLIHTTKLSPQAVDLFVVAPRESCADWGRGEFALQFQVQEPAQRMSKTRMVVKETEEFVLVDGILEFLNADGRGDVCVTACDAGDVFEATFPNNAGRVREAQAVTAPLELVREADDAIVCRAGWLRDNDEWWVSDGLSGHALVAQ